MVECHFSNGTFHESIRFHRNIGYKNANEPTCSNQINCRPNYPKVCALVKQSTQVELNVNYSFEAVRLNNGIDYIEMRPMDVS